MKSGSWASFQAAAPNEAKAGGEPDDLPVTPDELKTALQNLLSWATGANQRLTFEMDGTVQYGGNPYLNPVFRQAEALLARLK